MDAEEPDDAELLELVELLAPEEELELDELVDELLLLLEELLLELTLKLELLDDDEPPDGK